MECENCGGPKKHPGRRFCSHACSNSGAPKKKPTPVRLCQSCGIEYKAVAKSESKYCSRTCFAVGQAKSEQVSKVCIECGESFLTAGQRKTCSKKCQSARAISGRHPQRVIPKPCSECGQLTKNTKYCSRECQAIGMRFPVEYHVEKRRLANLNHKKRVKSQSVAKRRTLSADERQALLDAQDGLCAICQTKEARVVDHCHETGEIRGMLCYPCNTAIGALGDSVQGVMRGVKYLKQFEEASHSLA